MKVIGGVRYLSYHVVYLTVLCFTLAEDDSKVKDTVSKIIKFARILLFVLR